MFQTLFGDFFEKKLRKYYSYVKKINGLEHKIRSMTDNELQNQTSLFVERIQSNELLEDFLDEVFAVVREASRRILGLRHFDVQLIGGLVLHEGKVAEMKTGEGKTLVALLPAYANALIGNGVHVVTVNDYLASRDAIYVGQVYEFLGLTVGLIQQGMGLVERSLNYSHDITYVTNSELGFDYLRDNMVMSLDEVVQRPFYFSILDEVDSILIDEARTPLIISDKGNTVFDKYVKSNLLANLLVAGKHYEVDEKGKSIYFNEEGILFSEKYLGVMDLYDASDPWASYVFNSVKAKEFYVKNVHYIVRDEEVVIIDEFTGRIMVGRRWSDGLHQAIEAKEGIAVRSETETLASITYQNFFLLYPKFSGMTGTAITEEVELDQIYGLEVVSVPTNKKMIRNDLPDLLYKNQDAKWRSIVEECRSMYSLGRPVLVGTTTIQTSELLSSMLSNYGIPHSLLNARPENLKREAEIVAQAGRIGSVTIATNMAGRGTDILLGGNPEYMSKTLLRSFLSSILSKVDMEIKDIELEQTYLFLKTNLSSFNLLPSILEQPLDIVCDRIFTEKDPLLQLIHGCYKVLLTKFRKETATERDRVIALGGLHVIGTERHESRRIDNQLRGRSGRQGDPGSSVFFLSLDDNLLRIFGGDRMKNIMESLQVDDTIPIKSSFLSNSLESAQKKVESYNYDIRRQLFQYDEVLNYQRRSIYSERRRILESDDSRDWILCYAETVVSDYVDYYLKDKEKKFKDIDLLLTKIEDWLGIPYKLDRETLLNYSKLKVKRYLFRQVRLCYELREIQVDSNQVGFMRELETSLLLQKMDFAWKNHLQQINLLRENVGWRSYGQKDPLVEYKNEAYALFVSMVNDIRHAVVYTLLGSPFFMKD